MSPPGGRPITLKPHVTEAAAESVLEWWGRLGVRGILDGRHRFELHPVEPGTRLVQMETFTGVLVPLLARSLNSGTLAGFNLMNAALKSRGGRATNQCRGHPHNVRLKMPTALSTFCARSGCVVKPAAGGRMTDGNRTPDRGWAT